MNKNPTENGLQVTPQTADAEHVSNAGPQTGSTGVVGTEKTSSTPAVDHNTNSDAAREKAAKDHKAQLDKEQANLKKINDQTKDMSEFDKQDAYSKMAEDKLGEDSFRKAAREDREREAAEAEGDPTRDPAAKQKAMDMSGVQPGAVADAEKIKQVGKDDVADRAKARGTDGDVNPRYTSK